MICSYEESSRLEVENIHTYTNTQPNVWWCDLYIKDKKENTFFPGYQPGETKLSQQAKE